MNVKIIVNARDKIWPKPIIYYGDLVYLSGKYVHGMLYTITYSSGKDSGILKKGEKIFVKEGMIFNVSMTTNA